MGVEEGIADSVAATIVEIASLSFDNGVDLAPPQAGRRILSRNMATRRSDVFFMVFPILFR